MRRALVTLSLVVAQTGTLTATRDGQRIAIPRMAGVASADDVRFANWATYYDGQHVLFGDLTLQVIDR